MTETDRPPPGDRPARKPAPTAKERVSSQRPAIVRVYRAGAGEESEPVVELPLRETRYVIGRNRDAQIHLDDTTISRPHAELVCGPFGRWWLHDLGSTNGMEIGGVPFTERLLRHRDRVKLGSFVMEFRHAPRDVTIRPKRQSQPSISEDTLRIAHVAPPSSRERILPSHLATVTAVGRAMLTAETAEERLEALLGCFTGDALPGDASVALRIRRDGSNEVLAGPSRRFGPEAEGPYCSNAVLRAMWASRTTVVATNLDDLRDRDVELSLPAMVRPMAVIATPIHSEADYVDVLYVEFPWRYANEQWRALVELLADSYRQARMVWQMRQDLKASTRIEHDLEMAKELQSRLLPDCAAVDGVDVAVGYEPSHWVGGDYVDAFNLPDGRVLMVIADVCGKGLSAALVSSSVHTLIHAYCQAQGQTGGRLDLAWLVDRLNAYLCTHLPDDSFVTLLAVALDPQSGAVECLNAGHPAGVIVEPDGKRRWLQAERNVAVGMLSNASYEVQTTRLGQSETLLLFTDGAFERFDAATQSFDPNELVDALARRLGERPSASAADLEGYLSGMLKTRRGPKLHSDDTTFLVARYPSARVKT